MKKHLLCPAIGFLCAATGMLVQGQAADTTMEEIVVTGSRILHDPLTEKAPVTSLSAEDLDRVGLTNFGDILQQLPVAGSAINTRFNVPGNDGFPQDGSGIGAGATEVSLRNLGAKRTLVLVDGKRWIAGASASGVPSTVDFNTLPANAIERVEILQDGASAIYGSDAIGGVVNIITNRDFEGFKINGRGSSYWEGDGESLDVGVLWGVGNDQTHVVISASRTEERGIRTSDRDQSAFPTPFATSCEAGGCSSFTPQGRFVFGPAYAGGASVTLNNGVVNDGNTSIPVFDPNNPTAGDFHEFTASDRFNFNGYGFNFLRTPNERINLHANITHHLNDSVSLVAKAAYANRTSTTKAAPEPLCFGNGCGNRILDNIRIDADQIYNPFGIDLSVADGTLDFFGRRPLESGPRIFKQDVNTYFFSTGLEGEFNALGNNYNWDVTASYGNNRGTQQKFGSHNAAKLAIALADPSVCAAVPNCVPFNLFGGQGANGEGSITQDMIDYVTYTQRDISEQTLLDYAANITGAVAHLPAGNLSFAAGLEYREHDGSFDPDPIAARGETAGIPSGPTAGAFDVTEAYAEVNIPLLAAVPGAEYWEVNGAVRSSDYSSAGSETTYKVSTLWQPTNELSVRAAIATGIRAPGIGELFGGAAREDFTFLDPCADVLGAAGSANGGRDTPQPQNIIANCASLGIATSFLQTNPQLSARSLGNSKLTAETSDSRSVGVVYSPMIDGINWLNALTFSIDYYDLEVDNAIQGLFAGDIITNCVQTLDSAFCNLVERSPSGNINIVQNRLQNIGSIEASGYDLALTLTSPESSLGQFGLQLRATHLNDYTEFTPGNPNGDQLAGSITSETFQRAFPDWRGTSIFTWSYGNLDTGLTMRYASSMEQESGNTLKSKIFSDLYINYQVNEAMHLSFGGNNIFDVEPATCDSCGVIGMSPVINDIPSPVYYVGVSLDFQ